MATPHRIRNIRAVMAASLFAGLCGGVCHAVPADAEPAHDIRLVQFKSTPVEGGEPEVLAIPSVVTDEVILDETAVDEGATVLDATTFGETIAGGVPAEEVIVPAASRAADGMRVDDFSLEMPHEASSGDWFSSGRWYGGAEALWFDRSRVLRETIATNEGGGKLKVNAIPYDLSPGARITLGEHLGRDHLDRDRNVEMVYYGGLSFFQSDTLLGNDISTPLGPSVPGFNGANQYQTKHNTIFNSLEWNYKLARRLGRDQLVMGPNGNWSRHAERAFLPALIIGTRVANLNDSFTVLSSGTNVSGDYTIDAQNWLWGLNIGGELISRNEFFYWGLRGHVAPSMNFASSQQSVVGSSATQSVNRRDVGDQFAAGCISDLSLLAGWQVTPNFSLKAGYEFLWVGGIATAPRQFDLAGRRGSGWIDPGGQVFFNGLSLGCEGSW